LQGEIEGCPERDDPPNPVDTAYHSALPTQNLNEVFSFTSDLVINEPAEPDCDKGNSQHQ